MAVYFGRNKILDNGVAGTSLVLGHAQTHSLEGDDLVTPESIGAAPAQHTHDYARSPITQTVTLPRDAWSVFSTGCVQTIDVSSMRATSLALVAAHPAQADEYMAARVRCAMQGWDALTFYAKRLPAFDLDVNVLILG